MVTGAASLSPGAVSRISIASEWTTTRLTREIAPELTGHGLPLTKCEAYNRVYDQHVRSG